MVKKKYLLGIFTRKVSFLILLLLSLLSAGGYWYYKIKNNNDLKSIKNQLAEVVEGDPFLRDKQYDNMIPKLKYKIAIVAKTGGELAQALYLKQAAETLGWEMKIYLFSLKDKINDFLDLDPDFVLFDMGLIEDLPDVVKKHKSKKFGFYYHTIAWIDNKTLYKMLEQTDGLLFSDGRFKVFEDFYEKKNINFNGIYLALNATVGILKPSHPKYISIMGDLTEYRGSEEFKHLLSMLDKVGVLRAYGLREQYQFVFNSYRGYLFIPDDKLKSLNENGISLIVHKKTHINEGIPSGRITEAAAANTLIISDRHPFVIKYFGDNVLYFDASDDSEAMFKQIMDHYNWAINHPEEAKAMAQRAHEIFLSTFTSERDLTRIAKMYEYIKQKE